MNSLIFLTDNNKLLRLLRLHYKLFLVPLFHHSYHPNPTRMNHSHNAAKTDNEHYRYIQHIHLYGNMVLNLHTLSFHNHCNKLFHFSYKTKNQHSYIDQNNKKPLLYRYKKVFRHIPYRKNLIHIRYHIHQLTNSDTAPRILVHNSRKPHVADKN